MPKVTAAHEEATRQRIIEAGLRAFQQHGFHAATIQDIVRESGLSVGAIYSYFSGKDELLVVCCDVAMQQELARLADVIGPAPTVRDKLRIGVAFWFDFAITRPDEATFIVQAFAAAPTQPAIRQMLLRRRERLNAVGQMLLREGIARGELPAWLDVDAMAGGFSALLDGILLQFVEEAETFRRAPAERRATVFLDLLYAAAGVGPPVALRPT
jgi:AcrR family transcriptional regulator